MNSGSTHLDLSKVLEGVREQLIADPHPRPTSAPPDISRLSEANLFAFPASLYLQHQLNGAQNSMSIEGSPSTIVSAESHSTEYESNNKLSPIINDEVLRRLLEMNNLNSTSTFERKDQAELHRKDTDNEKSQDKMRLSSLSIQPNNTGIPSADLLTQPSTGTMDPLFNSFSSPMIPINISLNQDSNHLHVDPHPDYTSQPISPISSLNSNISSSQQQTQQNINSNIYSNFNFNSFGRPQNKVQHTSNLYEEMNSTNSLNSQSPPSQNTFTSHSDNTEFFNKNLVQHQYQQTQPQHQYHNEHYPQFTKDNSTIQQPHNSFSYKNPLGEEYQSSYNPDPGAKAKINSYPFNIHKTTTIAHSKLSQPTPVGNTTLADLVKNDCYQGRVLVIAKDQASGRLLQNKLETRNVEHIKAIFDESLDHFIELMTDPFANYLCQKLMEVCSPQQLTLIIVKVAPKIVNISLNMHGTRAAQRLIEMLSTNDQIDKVIQALSNSVVVLVKDINGNHVIQKCLSKLSPEKCNFIYHAMVKYCSAVATHRHGCCVLQRCVDTANIQQKEMLISEICQQAPNFVQDPYGNYVVQYILSLKDEKINDAIIKQFSNHIGVLSKHKFSSNVVEKCLSVGSPELQKTIINELLQGGPAALKELLLDPFANYVVQRALHVAKEPEFEQLVISIKPFLEDLQQSSAGSKLVSKLKKRFPTFSISDSSCTSPLSMRQSSLPASRVDNNLVSGSGYPTSQIYHPDINIPLPVHPISQHMQGFQQVPDQLNDNDVIHSQRFNHPSNSKKLNQAPFGNIMALGKIQPTLLMSDHFGHPNHFHPHTPLYTPSADPYVTPIMPTHAYPNHPTYFYTNDIQHTPAPNYLSPLHTYIPNTDMHLISSPRIMSIPSSYNNNNIFSRMSPLNLNTAYPTNTSSTGWV